MSIFHAFFRGALRWVFRSLLRWRLRGLHRALARKLVHEPLGRRKRESPLSSDIRRAGRRVARCTVRRAAHRAVRRAVRLPPNSIRNAESLVGESGATGPVMRIRKRGKYLRLCCWLTVGRRMGWGRRATRGGDTTAGRGGGRSERLFRRKAGAAGRGEGRRRERLAAFFKGDTATEMKDLATVGLPQTGRLAPEVLGE